MTNEDMNEDMGMTGDPRRCSRHPNVVTSSACGMFDAPCGSCEAEMDAPAPKPMTLHEALKSVADHCDHARTWDHVGFSGRDAEFANSIAAKDRITAKMEWYIARFVRKYRRQVVENAERKGTQITQGLKGKAKVAAVDAFLNTLVWEHQTEAEVAVASAPKLVISAACGAQTGDVKHFIVRFPYSPATLDTFKNAFADWRDRKFDKSDPKDAKWIVVPTAQTVATLRKLVANHGFYATPGAVLAFEKVSPAVAA